MAAHDAGQRVGVAEAEAGVAEQLGRRDQFDLLGVLLVQPFRHRLATEGAPTRQHWLRALVSTAPVIRSVQVLRAHPLLPVLTLLGSSFPALQACVTSFTATYLVARHSASLAEAGVTVAVMLGASAVGRIALGWLADRLDRGARYLAFQAHLAAGAVWAFPCRGG